MPGHEELLSLLLVMVPGSLQPEFLAQSAFAGPMFSESLSLCAGQHRALRWMLGGTKAGTALTRAHFPLLQPPGCLDP